MQQQPLPLRVAVVQMDAHLAFEGPGALFLKEPLAEPYLSQLHVRLPPGSPLLEDLERLQQSIARAYDRGLLVRVEAILRYCASHGSHLVVFPEYSIPGSLLPQLRGLAAELRMTLVAGTHLVTDELLDTPHYCACFAEPPPVNHAIAPVIDPDPETPVRFQLKLWPSQWEPDLDLGEDVERFVRDGVSFGVAICIDFIRNRDEVSAAKHQKWSENHLLVVASATPGSSPRAFEAAAQSVYQHFTIPVAFANHASQGGGSTIFAYGKPDGAPLAADTALPPLPPPHEGLCIAELRLDHTAKKSPSSVIQVFSVQPLAYALIQPAAADPELARAAETLAAATTPAEFKERCRGLRPVLARAARQYKGVALVHRRWAFLEKAASGLHRLDALKRLASDLWLPEDVPTSVEIERALALGAIQVLRGLAERPGVSKEDRDACVSALQALERAAERLSTPATSLSKELLEDVVSVLLPASGSSSRATIHPDGSVVAWLRDPGPPPSHLVELKYRLWDRATLQPQVVDDSPDERRELYSYLSDLDDAATWLALEGSPPAWVGWSPNDTPVVVVPPGHVILLSSVIPPEADLRLARTTAGKPLPIALLLGDCEGLSASLPSDLQPLQQAIRRLALDEEHLRSLASFEYSTLRANFIEPTCSVGFKDSPPQRLGTSALMRWFDSEDPIATLCGAIGDGRTTLVRTWLSGLSRDALLRGGIPILYVDGATWEASNHISDLLKPRPPDRIAALRLAVSTGNCLLVLDGFDAIRPSALLDHPFFRGWISTDENPFLLYVTCWPESLGALIRLNPVTPHEPWPREVQSPFLPPRSFIASATSKTDVEHPSFHVLDAFMGRVAEVLKVATPPSAERQGVDPVILFEELSRALWTSRAVSPETSSLITMSALRRHIHVRRGRDANIDKLIRTLLEMHQSLVSNTPYRRSRSSTWKWRDLQGFLHGLLLPSRGPEVGDLGATQWLGFAWEALLHYFLATQVVRSLCSGAPTTLDMLPLHPDTIDYCREHPRWHETLPLLHQILHGDVGAPPAARVNALILSCHAESLGSSVEAPWILAGLDLRCLDLRSARLEHANMAGARLCHTLMSSAKLRDADLTNADLEGCDLRDSDLTGARALDAKFTGTALDGANFTSCDLRGADLSRSVAITRPLTVAGATLEGAALCATDWLVSPREGVDQKTKLAVWSRYTENPQEFDEYLTSPRLGNGAIAWSPNDHFIAHGDHQGRLWLWSSGPIRCLAVRTAHSAAIRSLAFSPDGDMLAAAGDDHLVSLWRTSDLSAMGCLDANAVVTGLFWESQESLLTFSGRVRRWSLVTGSSSDILPDIADAQGGALTRDGAHLVTVSSARMTHGIVRVYDLTDGECVRSYETRNAGVDAINLATQRIVVHADDISICSFFSDASVPLQARRTGDFIHPTHYPNTGWTSDGEIVAIMGRPSGTIRLWATRSGREIRTIKARPNSVSPGILFSHRSHRLAVIDGNGLGVFDTDTDTVAYAPRLHFYHTPHERLRWTTSGLRLHNSECIIDIVLDGSQCRRKVMRWGEHQCGSGPPAPGHTGNLYIYSDGENFAVWDEAARGITPLEILPNRSATPYWSEPFTYWTDDDQRVGLQRATGDHSGEYTVWDVTTGQLRAHGEISDLGSMVLFDGDEFLVMTSRSGGPLHLIDSARQVRVSVRVAHCTRTFQSASGRYLGLIDSYSDVRVLATTTLRSILLDAKSNSVRDLEAADESHFPLHVKHSPNVWDAAIAESAGLLLVATDHHVHAHSLEDGALVWSSQEACGASLLAVSPDERHVASVADDGLRIWSLRDGSLIGRVVVLASGAVVISNRGFQRLENRDGSLPSLEGFYARSGVRLWPLDRLTDLESRDLCGNLWKTLTEPRA